MGRPLEYCKNEALKKAMHVFWSKGYEASSLEDLLKAMGISKSSFYQSFGSKCDLFKNSLKLYIKTSHKALHEHLHQNDDFLQNLKGVLEAVADDTPCHKSRKGCFISNAATEFSQDNPEIAAIVSEGLNGFEKEIYDAIQAGQKNGSIKNTLCAIELSKLFLTLHAGLQTMVKSGASKADVDVNISAILKIF